MPDPSHNNLGPRHALLQLPHRFADLMLDLLFPPRCPACGEGLALQEPGGALCAGCERDVPSFDGPTCARCSLPLGEGVDSAHCPDCTRNKFVFTRTFALGPHLGVLKAMVHRAKYRHAMRPAIVLGERMAASYSELRGSGALVAPVPMHWWPKLRRTYNQAEVMAEVLARRCGLTYLPQVLRCVRTTQSQVGLTPQERRDNVRAAFTVHPRARLKGRRVLIVDDVLTSGATVNEAARVLRKAGAKEIWIAVATRTALTDHPMKPDDPIDEYEEATPEDDEQ